MGYLSGFYVLKSLIKSFSSLLYFFIHCKKKKAGKGKGVFPTSVTITYRKILTKSIYFRICKHEVVRTTHENSTQKQHEICRCETAKATPGCTEESGRVGEWDAKRNGNSSA